MSVVPLVAVHGQDVAETRERHQGPQTGARVAQLDPAPESPERERQPGAVMP